MNKTLWLATILAGIAAATAANAVTITPSPVSVTVPQEVPKTHVITLTNTTGAPLSFGLTTVTGPDAGDMGIALDTCALHTINPTKRCHVHVTITASDDIGTIENATVTLNDAGGAAVGSDDILAKVKPGLLNVTKSGHNAVVHNKTANFVFMDFSTSGNLDVTGGSCTDEISPDSTCTITTTGKGGLQVLLNAGQGNVNFDLNF